MLLILHTRSILLDNVQLGYNFMTTCQEEGSLEAIQNNYETGIFLGRDSQPNKL